MVDPGWPCIGLASRAIHIYIYTYHNANHAHTRRALSAFAFCLASSESSLLLLLSDDGAAARLAEVFAGTAAFFACPSESLLLSSFPVLNTIEFAGRTNCCAGLAPAGTKKRSSAAWADTPLGQYRSNRPKMVLPKRDTLQLNASVQACRPFGISPHLRSPVLACLSQQPNRERAQELSTGQ